MMMYRCVLICVMMSVESLYICTIVLCIDVMMYRYCELSKMSDGGGVGMEDVREVSYVL